MTKEQLKKLMGVLVREMRKEVRNVIKEELNTLMEGYSSNKNIVESKKQITNPKSQPLPTGAKKTLANFKNEMLRNILEETTISPGFGEETANINSVTDMAPTGDEVVDGVLNNITKDYSALMQAMNKKKKGGL